MTRNTLLAVLCAASLAPVALAQEEPEPSVERPGRSVQVPGGTVVLPPHPIPPEELIGEDPRVLRAALLLDRVDVLDTFAARFARQGRRVLDGRQVDCAAVAAIDHALDLTLGASQAARRTVTAELELLPTFAALDGLRERAGQASARASDVDDELWPALSAAFESRCPASATAPPTPWLPDDERSAADGMAVIFVKTKRVRAVVWLDGAPAGVGDGTGWAVVVAPSRAVSLCEAEPEDDECTERVEVDASPAAAFDLGS